MAGWMERLQSNAASFEDPDALMLPHAVDDTCCAVGSFGLARSTKAVPLGWRKWPGCIIAIRLTKRIYARLRGHSCVVLSLALGYERVDRNGR